MLGLRTHCLLQFPMQQWAFFHLLSPGHLQEVGKACAKQASYRKPAWAWPSAKKSYTCCSTRLFLRNNHLYSSSIGIHLLPPSEVKSTHSHIPEIHTPQSADASRLLGIANAYHTRALTDGGSRTKWGPRPRQVFPVIIIKQPTLHLPSRAATNPV
jgi:hypothetical protein